MKKNEWWIILTPLAITLIVDRLTKAWALHLPTGISTPILSFEVHQNANAMLGLFSNLPEVLRIVSLSTGGVFLFFIYALIQYLLPIRSPTLRSGLSILVGGILGNVADRIIWGYVVDFIILGPAKSPHYIFNVADIFQGVGYAMIAYAFIREGNKLWPENDARKLYWINPRFQLKYCFLLLAVGFGITTMAMVFSYTYWRVTLIEVAGNNPAILDKFLIPYAITFSIVSVGACVVLFTVGRLISHKIAGPIYAFERFMNDTLEGKNRKFKLRAKDEFKELEEMAMKIREKMSPTLVGSSNDIVISTQDIGRESDGSSS
jgi:signal peptidase II